ncbi:helix-turn-helix domain-containing protein [Chitinophaga flava]|uniref:AraC family transcriptional regulator n=1 Tax=Chitinophaga flava TaxID=2259036 RepID=A0A365XST7_9BACT|nr:response regulator transcription factor [Chitinophaga flava]RBL89422.1 AraC family transcriptional regulator [Chitinophaga flava]
MSDTESIEQFYQHKFNHAPNGVELDSGHFNVFDLAETIGPGKPRPYQRRDFYKIMLIRGDNIFHYADKSIPANGAALTFFNPDVPYKCEQRGSTSGYFCIFKEGFFSDHLRSSLKDLPVFTPGSSPIFLLNKQQERLIEDIFSKMRSEITTDYPFKYNLIRSYVTELIHQAMKLQPMEQIYQQTDANARITAVFRELLERQFPISSGAQQFKLRSAADYAGMLNIHVNHLNRAVRTTTGKTTTRLISERLLSEARALLAHTNWNIAEIGYCLGFEEAGNFNHFFKKNTGITPGTYRQQIS